MFFNPHGHAGSYPLGTTPKRRSRRIGKSARVRFYFLPNSAGIVTRAVMKNAGKVEIHAQMKKF